MADGRIVVEYDLRRFRWVPAVDKAVQLLHKHFLNRTDRLCHMASWGSPCPVAGNQHLEAYLRAHVAKKVTDFYWITKKGNKGETKGAFRVGTYAPALDGTTKWLCMDFDGGGDHAAPLVDPLCVARAVAKRCEAAGVPVYLERSKSLKGWHLWVFFEPAIPAGVARQLGFALAPVDAALTDGTFADVKRAKGIEVFPKADTLPEDGVGNQTWLPWYWNSQPGGGVFYRENPRGFEPWVPDNFATVNEARVGEALAVLITNRGDSETATPTQAPVGDTSIADAAAPPKDGTLPHRRNGKLTPWGDFNLRGWDWPRLIPDWECVGRDGRVMHWRRPGKGEGSSATTGHCLGDNGEELFHVFTSGAPPFAQDKTYNKFQVYALKHHNGDHSAAARAVIAMGFVGERDAPFAATAPPEGGDWSARAREHQAALTAEHRAALAKRLKIPEAALASVPLGWLDAGTGSCPTVAEVDGSGAVVGITRLDGDDEMPMKGGRRGVVFMPGWQERVAADLPIICAAMPETAIRDAMAFAAAGLPAAALPAHKSVAALAAHLQSLEKPGAVIVLADLRGSNIAEELKKQLPAWTVRHGSFPDLHPSGLSWVVSHDTDPTCADAWGALGERLLEEIGCPAEVGGAQAGGRPTYAFNVVDAATFFSTKHTIDWLIDDFWVKGQPGVIGAPRKSLKTSIGIDLAVSLATGTPFLGVERFRVPRPCKVAFLSGESGDAVIEETFRRVCAARGVDPASLNVLLGFDLPQLANPADVAALVEGLKKHAVDALEIDPAYLCLLAGLEGKAINPANLFEIGAHILGVLRACLSAGCTPILIHHTRKNLQKPFDPLDLEELAFSGFQEASRQWLLLNRRERYEPGTGTHKLWLSVGGSAGQGGEWALDIYEGTGNASEGRREWRVTLEGARQNREVTAAAREAKKKKDEETRVLNALKWLLKQKGDVNGTVRYSDVVDESGLKSGDAKKAIGRLSREGVIEVLTLPKEKGRPGPAAQGVRWTPDGLEEHKSQYDRLMEGVPRRGHRAERECCE